MEIETLQELFKLYDTKYLIYNSSTPQRFVLEMQPRVEQIKNIIMNFLESINPKKLTPQIKEIIYVEPPENNKDFDAQKNYLVQTMNVSRQLSFKLGIFKWNPQEHMIQLLDETGKIKLGLQKVKEKK